MNFYKIVHMLEVVSYILEIVTQSWRSQPKLNTMVETYISDLLNTYEKHDTLGVHKSTALWNTSMHSQNA